jgi:hypothetical protein
MLEKFEKLNLGSIGFAQLGSKDYYEKRIVERSVLAKLLWTDKFENKFPDLCIIKIVIEPYEDSSYDEVAVCYDWRKLDSIEVSDPEKVEQFWEWFGVLESYDFESEMLMRECEIMYADQLKLEVVKNEEKSFVPVMKVGEVDFSNFGMDQKNAVKGYIGNF